MLWIKPVLIKQIQTEALSSGKFTLASGQESNYYIDLSKILFSNGLELLCKVILDEVNFTDIDAIGGPAIGAIPIVSGIQVLRPYIGRSFFTRKETKEYGKKELIEGNLRKDDEVLLFEDVTTTGNSLLRSALAVKEYGANVREVISVLDRNQGAKELFAQNNLSFRSLINIDEVLKRSLINIDEVLNK